MQSQKHSAHPSYGRFFLPVCILRQVKWAVRQILTQKNASRPSSLEGLHTGRTSPRLFDPLPPLSEIEVLNLNPFIILALKRPSPMAMDVLCNLPPLASFCRFLCPHLSEVGEEKEASRRSCSNLRPLQGRCMPCSLAPSARWLVVPFSHLTPRP